MTLVGTLIGVGIVGAVILIFLVGTDANIEEMHRMEQEQDEQ